MTTSPTHLDGLSAVIAWMDHEASLLEILAYRLDGLTNVLRSKRHGMVCTAASDVDAVHDQLMRAAVHRDLALLSVAGDDLPTMQELESHAGDGERQQLAMARQRLHDAVAEVDRARSECTGAAEAYRPR